MIRKIDLGQTQESFITAEEAKKLELSGIWIELVDPSSEELQAISDATEIPVRFLRLPSSRASVDLRLEPSFNAVTFAVMRDVASTKEAFPIVVAFAKNFLVTTTISQMQDIVDSAKERLSKSKMDSPAEVAYYIIDEIVASHFSHLEKLESMTSQVEEEVVEGTSATTLKKIFKLKSRMISFNKVLWYERGLIYNLRQCEACMPAKAKALFATTHEDLTRQIDIIETYREILSDAINVHLSAVSNKINLSIKSLTVVIFYLTIVTTVTAFPNTVATFFGISQFGNTNVIIILALIIISSVLPVVWLWKKRWLKPPTSEI